MSNDRDGLMDEPPSKWDLLSLFFTPIALPSFEQSASMALVWVVTFEQIAQNS